MADGAEMPLLAHESLAEKRGIHRGLRCKMSREQVEEIVQDCP